MERRSLLSMFLSIPALALPIPSGESCRTCQYYMSGDSTCHRYPPPEPGSRNMNGTLIWPAVKTSDWCGEFLVASTRRHRP